MFQLLCVCLFVTKYANGYHTFEPRHEGNNDEDLKRKMLAFYEQSSWAYSPNQPSPSELDMRFGTSYDSPITIIRPPTIERTYRTDITVQQMTHPYLYTMMQMIPIKGQVSFQYVYQKLFQFFIALKKFQPFNIDQIPRILQFVFPELGDKVYEIAKLPLGPPMLMALFETIFPGLSKQDMHLIFGNAQTTKEVIINLILYLCPNIREHFLWKDNLSVDGKLHAIFNILFPGATAPELQEHVDFPQKIYKFLDMLFQGKLILNTERPPQMDGPEWLTFQNALHHQFNINYETVPKEILIYLFSHYQTPEFNTYVNQLKHKLDDEKQPHMMDQSEVLLWKQYLNDLKTHKKTLNDMPLSLALFMREHKNPQEFIKTFSNYLGFPVDASKLDLPLDPKIKALWTKFASDLMVHHGDTTHLPKELLDYFSGLSRNPDYKSYLDSIFDSLYIKPEIVSEWNTFFDELRDGKKTLDQMPSKLTTFLENTEHPEEFLRLILKLKDAKSNTNFLNIDTNPKMLQLWKQYIQDVAANKGNIQNMPHELLNYFYKISSNPANSEYIKLIFGPDRINPKTLNIWKQYIKDLKQHRVNLKDMPSEIIQLMLKYKSPDEFFKVVLPNSNIQAVPNDVVKDQWKDWTTSLQNHNVSIHDTPKELKNFFHEISPSKDYQTTLNNIFYINPDLLMKWHLFMNDLKQHKKSLSTMPEDLKKYISDMSPKEFVNLIFKGLVPPLNDPIPTPESYKDVEEDWKTFLESLNTKNDADVVLYPYTLNNYWKNASDNANYKEDLNKIYQLSEKVKTKFEEFRTKILNDYNVTLESLPKEIVSLMSTFDDLSYFFTAIQASYPGNYTVKVLPYEREDVATNWLFCFSNMMKIINEKHSTEIYPLTKLTIKMITIDTPLDRQIDEIFKMHERNALIKRTEEYLKKTKTQPKVDDGLKVFLQVLRNLGRYYARSEELCEERSRIVAVFDEVKADFAAKSDCTIDKLLTQLKKGEL